ncbi:hypothetical protein AGR7B_Cc150095 [Agrobacterium deltaense RV3]|nr:hypothetical protein AGR7B_Cc150095 [Agrobacterium deltaense RV3]
MENARRRPHVSAEAKGTNPLVAEFATTDSQVNLLASYDAESGRMRIVPVATGKTDEKSLELWLVMDGGQDPLAWRLPAGHERRPRHSRRHARHHNGWNDLRNQRGALWRLSDRSGNRPVHRYRHGAASASFQTGLAPPERSFCAALIIGGGKS